MTRRRRRPLGHRVTRRTARRLGSVLGWLAAVVFYALVGEPARRAAFPEASFEGRVVRVVDGDTLVVEGVTPRVRLWGVDAPERTEEGYFEAGAALVGFVRGRALSCDVVERDRYGRVVARCTRDDGEDVGALMINSGAADEYWRYTQGRYTIERWLAPRRS